MGNSSSQTLKEYITTNVSYTQNVSTALNLQNETAASTTSIQVVDVENGAPACCVYTDDEGNSITLPGCTSGDATINCPAGFFISQVADQGINVIQSISSEFAQQLATQIQNTAQADLSNALDLIQQNDPTEIDDKTRQDMETTVTNNLSTVLNSKTTLSLVNSAVANSYNKQTIKLVNCGTITGGQCNFTQDASATIVVQNLLTSIASLVQNNSEINDVYTKVNNSLTSEQEGVVGTLAGVFDKMFSALGNLALVFIIGGAVVVFIIILLAVYLLFFRKGRKAPVPSFTYGTPASSYETPASSYGPVPSVRR